MCVLPQLNRNRLLNQIESAASVHLSPSHRFELTPTELARLRGCERSTIYRRAQALFQKLSTLPQLRASLTTLSHENLALRSQLSALQSQISPLQKGYHIEVTKEKLALTTLELAARNSSVSDIQATLMTAFSLPKPPSDGTICNIIRQGAQLATQLLESAKYHFPLDAIEFDELFHAKSPILAALEPYSMSLLFLHQLGDCKTDTWQFCFDYLGTSLPPLMVHDCSKQGGALAKRVGKKSQLCVWHRIRELGRELRPALERVYKESLSELDEARWEQAEELELHFQSLSGLTHNLDPYRFCVRRYQSGCQELLDWCATFRRQLSDLGLSCPSLDGLSFRSKEYLAHLRQWERLAQEVVFSEQEEESDGFLLLDALAEVHLREKRLVEIVGEYGESEPYRGEERLFLKACEKLRRVQSLVSNAGPIGQKFGLLVNDQVRTSSRVEALNRRLRGFTDAKRHVTEQQLHLMQLHHNTTFFSADAKRAVRI